MKNKIFIGLILCFIVLVVGMSLIIFAAKDRILPMMHAGLGLLVISSLGYLVLFIISLRKWLQVKER